MIFKIKILFNKIILKIVKVFLIPKSQIFYSQSGEDLILFHLFNKIGIRNPTYIDIGANEPKFISNTFWFYKNGSTGILIEPNPFLFSKLKSQRKRDVILNCGIGVSQKEKADFYLFPKSASGLGTFSEKDANFWHETGLAGVGKIKYEKVIQVNLIRINNILEKYFGTEKEVNLISLDVEGLDLEILKSIDFKKYSPQVICVETLKYDENQIEHKNASIIDFMLMSGYEIYADTRINTIFCKTGLLNKA